MKIAIAQMRMLDDMSQNHEHALKLVREAADGGARLVCFPEIQLTPFFPQYAGRDAGRYAIDMDSAYIRDLASICRKAGIFAVPNYYIQENGRYYDMSLLIDDRGEIIGRQKMVHIAQCEQFYERDYYTASEEGFQVFKTPMGRIGIVVCFDRHYPESIRTEALRGADLIIVPTANTKAEPAELFRWEIKIQAFHNSVNIAMCNRTGIEGDMAFSGDSIVADYDGNTLALAGDHEELLFTDVDMAGCQAARNRKPYTQLREKAFYE